METQVALFEHGVQLQGPVGFKTDEVVSFVQDRGTHLGVVRHKSGEIVHIETLQDGKWVHRGVHMATNQVITIPGLSGRIGFLVAYLRFWQIDEQMWVAIGPLRNDTSLRSALLTEATPLAIFVHAWCVNDWQMTWEHRREILAGHNVDFWQFFKLLTRQQTPERTLWEMLDDPWAHLEENLAERIAREIESVELLIILLAESETEDRVVALVNRIKRLNAWKQVPAELQARVGAILAAKEEREVHEQNLRILSGGRWVKDDDD